ncbi:MAG: DUF5320 domain-containing protein [Promethearchaeota archaeon]
MDICIPITLIHSFHGGLHAACSHKYMDMAYCHFFSKADERRLLEDQAKTLESQLAEIRKRLTELKE